MLCSCSNKTPPAESQSNTASPPSPASYVPRVGVAVSTGGRTCVAIQNPHIAVNIPVTLVSPIAPQTFAQGQITGTSPTPCPINKEVNPSFSSYDIRLASGASVQKLTPLIAIAGTSAPFSISNNSVQADLDQNGKTETFRACSGNDGIHLTIWFGQPLTGVLLWHGYNYDPGGTTLAPACTGKETSNP